MKVQLRKTLTLVIIKKVIGSDILAGVPVLADSQSRLRSFYVGLHKFRAISAYGYQIQRVYKMTSERGVASLTLMDLNIRW